jgi:hypothetical protein
MKLTQNSREKTEGKIYSVRITPFVDRREDENQITTVKIQLKSKQVHSTEIQEILVRSMNSYSSSLSSITPVSISSFMSESMNFSNPDSTLNETNGDVYEAMKYNNPRLPIGKENNENFKIKLLTQLKSEKFPIFNSAAKKRKYSCISMMEDIPSKFRKISSVKRLYESNIKLHSGNSISYFKIYRDNDIFINCERYEDLLIDSNQDDDVDTDEEQLKMASDCVNKMLGKAIKEKLINEYI